MEQIGEIKQIRRYPVKGMSGEDLEEATVTLNGIVGDRVYAFVDDNSPSPRFPWMTSRQAREFLLYEPRFLSVPSRIEIKSKDGSCYLIDDKEFENMLEEKYGYSLSLKYNENGCFDSKPISLISLDTVRELEKETGVILDHRRFRANFYAKWSNDRPFYEDELVGRSLQVGDVRIEIVKKDSRCVVPTLDPKTSEASPILLKVIQSNHRGCAGVYATVKQEGSAKVDESIFLID